MVRLSVIGPAREVLEKLSAIPEIGKITVTGTAGEATDFKIEPERNGDICPDISKEMLAGGWAITQLYSCLLYTSINHATVRLKDINELFMDTGLGRDGYSMIGQGKISDIVSRKSDDRREMFEEAAGISRFRYRKTEAERKLSAAEENLVRLRDIMQELTLRVGPVSYTHLDVYKRQAEAKGCRGYQRKLIGGRQAMKIKL